MAVYFRTIEIISKLIPKLAKKVSQSEDTLTILRCFEVTAEVISKLIQKMAKKASQRDVRSSLKLLSV